MIVRTRGAVLMVLDGLTAVTYRFVLLGLSPLDAILFCHVQLNGDVSKMTSVMTFTDTSKGTAVSEGRAMSATWAVTVA